MKTVRIAAAAVVAMVVTTAPAAGADPNTITRTQLPDPDTERPSVPRRANLSPAVSSEHAGVRVPVRPGHRDMAAGNCVAVVHVEIVDSGRSCLSRERPESAFNGNP